MAKVLNRRFHTLRYMRAQTIEVNRKAITDLVRLKEEFDSIIESLELMSDKDFMESYAKVKEQIAKREFKDWNDV